MALDLSTPPETNNGEQELFQRLNGLYEEQRQIYSQVLELSQKQGNLVRNGSNLSEIRQILQKKNVCLEIIKRLELTERSTKIAWERGRQKWSPVRQATLNLTLQKVGSVIEEILVCEEKNDQEFINQMRTM